MAYFKKKKIGAPQKKKVGAPQKKIGAPQKKILIKMSLIRYFDVV